MIALTDVLKAAFIAAAGWQDEPWRFNNEVLDGLTAVLAADRAVPPGRCSVALELISAGGDPSGDLWCQLRHGHAGDHGNGPTRWRGHSRTDAEVIARLAIHYVNCPESEALTGEPYDALVHAVRVHERQAANDQIGRS